MAIICGYCARVCVYRVEQAKALNLLFGLVVMCGIAMLFFPHLILLIVCLFALGVDVHVTMGAVLSVTASLPRRGTASSL